MEPKSHWEGVYASKRPSEVSWYQEHLRVSLDMIGRSGISRDDCIIDAGGGASTLVDDLLDRGFRNVTVIDISQKAVEASQTRLGSRSGQVRWIVSDLLEASLEEGRYRLWHDRAVLHFLTDADSRRNYVAQVRHALARGGRLVISTFSTEGPPKCSGLAVSRYTAESLLAEFGEGFRLIESRTEHHRTPSGATQEFLYCAIAFDGPG